MVKRLLNPDQSADNILKATSDLAHDSTPKWKGTVTIVTATGLTGIVFIDAKGVEKTVAVSPAATTKKTVSAKIQEIFVANGYIVDRGLQNQALGVTVTPNSTNLDIVFMGDVKVISVSTIAVTNVAI